MRHLVAAFVLVGSTHAHAFGEDVCYRPGGGRIVSCLPLPPACRPVGTETPACKAAILRRVAQVNRFDGGRSTVHTDATYILAQAVGFSPTDAYWIAAYDEATDLGTFTPRDNASRPVGDGALTTADLDGLRRTNLASGGVLLHYVVPYNGGLGTPPPDVDGLRPDPTDAHVEVTLANLRAWALAPSSDAVPACTAGLTVPSPDGDLATGPACYPDGTPIDGQISLVGPAGFTLATETGAQLVDPGRPPVLAPGFDALVATDGAADPSPEHASNARFGVYLHVLADRISHHRCGDRSVISGPDADGFFADLDDRACNQPIHLLRHAWETGVPFRLVAPEDRTTLAVLEAVYDELVVFAEARGVLRADARSPRRKAEYVLRLAAALQQFQAVDRVRALNAVACRSGHEPLPGQPACRVP